MSASGGGEFVVARAGGGGDGAPTFGREVRRMQDGLAALQLKQAKVKRAHLLKAAYLK